MHHRRRREASLVNVHHIVWCSTRWQDPPRRCERNRTSKRRKIKKNVPKITPRCPKLQKTSQKQLQISSSLLRVFDQEESKSDTFDQDGDEITSNVSLPSNASALSFPLVPVLEQITSGPADCPNDGFVLHRGKKRRFDHTQQVEPPVSSSEVAWTSNNFYAVLAEIPVNFAICDYGRDAMTDDDDITPFQVFPVLPSVPESVLSASARTKRVVKVIAGDATIVKVDDDWVAMDEFCGQLHEQVHQASKQTTEIVEHQVTKVGRAEVFLRTENNIDYIIEDIMRQPWTHSQTFLRFARNGDSAVETISDLHAFNRLLVSCTDVVLPYVNRQCLEGRKSLRHVLSVRDLLESWFEPSSDVDCDEVRLLDELRAVALR